MAQRLASFFGDDGMLLKKFVYRVEPHEGLKKIEPVVKRIAAPAQAGVELRFFFFLVLPLLLFLVLLLGLLVRSFPGPGDTGDRGARARPARAPGRRPPAQGGERGLGRRPA